ncbi:hypothetical protein JHK85_037876 [Glycine max]|nr:hypothetical protein JHK85_037876 [Glycine max]
MDGNKLTSHVADDSISYSLDSLSFSGLVCIQDHQPKLPSPNRAKHYQITPADQLISNGRLQPQALAIQTNQSLLTNLPSSSSSLLATRSSSKMPSGRTDSKMKYHEQLNKASKHTNKKSTVTRTGFGQKMKSFLSPCRECQTIKQGAVKAQTVPGENLKIY